LERRFVAFTTDKSIDTRTRGIRGVVGVGLVGITYIVTDKLFKALLPYVWAKLFAMFVVAFIAVFVVPFAFSALERRMGKPSGEQVPDDDEAR